MWFNSGLACWGWTQTHAVLSPVPLFLFGTDGWTERNLTKVLARRIARLFAEADLTFVGTRQCSRKPARRLYRVPDPPVRSQSKRMSFYHGEALADSVQGPGN
jgi:hypothetical protein